MNDFSLNFFGRIAALEHDDMDGNYVVSGFVVDAAIYYEGGLPSFL